jgi:adenine phosphoribosyltransferase
MSNPKNKPSINFKKYIRSVPDFPKTGIMFRDITTILMNEKILRAAVDAFAKKFQRKKIQKIIAIESRGFIFGAMLAYKLKCGFIPIRKPKKLPLQNLLISKEYSLEYGKDTLEMHRDALKNKERVLLIDDLLATGGTMEAAAWMVEQTGACIAGIAFLIELDFLHGRDKLGTYNVFSLVHYKNEK